MKTKLDISCEKLKENTCFSCGRLRLHAGCCKLGNLHDTFMTLAIANLALPIALDGLKNVGFL